MARTEFIAPVRELHGAFTNDGTIFRRKIYRDDNGRIKGMSKPESYRICNPRNWKKKPAKGKELEHQLLFKQACAETKRILLPSKPEAYAKEHNGATPTQEEIATLKYWKDRYNAQLKHPEKQTPIDPKTNKCKIYLRLDAFIRTCLLRNT